MTDVPKTESDKSSVLHLSIDKKIDLVQQIYLRHGDIDHAWKVLQHNMRFSVRRSEAATGYIIGDPRCGKSETAKRWIQKTCGKRPLKGMQYQLIEGNGKRIVYADLTNGSTPFIATCEILDKLFTDITVKRLSESTAAGRLIDQFGFHGIDQLIIDEGQKMFRGKGPGAASKLASWLVAIENARLFGTVVLGDTRLLDLFDEDDAVNQRKAGLALLKPFPFATADDEADFEDFVVEFERMLPVVRTPITEGTERCSPLMLLAIYYSTRGTPGALSKICEVALEAADERLGGKNVDSLEKADFIQAFDFLLKHDPRMKGVNPFKVHDRRSIPTLPFSSKDAGFTTNTDGRRRTRSRIGGRILAKS